MIKSKAKRRRRDYPNHRFVVYTHPVGRTKPGVYERAVTLDGKIAFVWPDEGKHQADVLPALNVFDTKEDAHAFFTKGGVVRWIVHNEHGSPEVFPARIKTYFEKRYGRMETRITVISRLDRKPVASSYNMVDYETEAQAYRHFFSDMPKMLQDASRSIRSAQTRKRALLQIQRKMKALGITRGYKKRGRV